MQFSQETWMLHTKSVLKSLKILKGRTILRLLKINEEIREEFLFGIKKKRSNLDRTAWIKRRKQSSQPSRLNDTATEKNKLAWQQFLVNNFN